MTGQDQPTSRFVRGQLVYLQIPAVDVTASARFYERVLGWRVDPPGSGFEAPGLIGQWITDRPSAPDSGPVMWIAVDDLARTLTEAARAGGALRQEPTPDGPRVLASFSDPAGNLVGIVAHGAADRTRGPPGSPRHPDLRDADRSRRRRGRVLVPRGAGRRGAVGPGRRRRLGDRRCAVLPPRGQPE